ncbi:MAG: hypothetical protein ACQESR_30665 [Planctomycetota bacterium]
MSTTTTITNVCRIAEDYGREIGLAPFEIDRLVRAKKEDKDEWVLHVQFGELDPLVQNDNHGAIIVVDAITKEPRLVEGL